MTRVCYLCGGWVDEPTPREARLRIKTCRCEEPEPCPRCEDWHNPSRLCVGTGIGF